MTLEAVPVSESEHRGWLGETCSAIGPCTFEMTRDVSLTAVFDLTTYKLSIMKDGGLSSVCSYYSSPSQGGFCEGQPWARSFPSGSNVEVTVYTTSTEPVLVEWSGDAQGFGRSRWVQMTRNITLRYSVKPALEVKLSSTYGGRGVVTSSPSGIDCGTECIALFPPSSSVTLQAEAEPGSIFTGWSGGGCSGTGTCTTVSSGRVSATFERMFSNLSLRVFGAGQVRVNGGHVCEYYCAYGFPQLTSVELDAFPKEGHYLAEWRGVACSTSHCDLYLESDTQVEAVFPKKGGTSVSLKTWKDARKLFAAGRVTPDHPNKRAQIDLMKKRDGVFRIVSSKTTRLAVDSGYKVSFKRPRQGRCRIKVRFSGDEDHLGSSVLGKSLGC